MPSLKELTSRPTVFTGGHRACAGCGAAITFRMLLETPDVPIVAAISTGCMEVVSTIFPFTAWKCSYIHSAFENSAATMSGVESAYRALTRRGKLNQEFRFIAMGGDGGTYDIGLQSLSGAMERGHRMLYVCYDNQAYMNTGIQRSSATPMWAHTTTSPAGEMVPGKREARKDITAVMVAHEIPYAAQATPAMWSDLTRKVEKALNTDGPTFINVLAPCPLGWGFPTEDTISISRDAADTCYWPLYEVVNGEYKITYKPKEKKPVADFLKRQTRYRHLFQKGNEQLLKDIQECVDTKWARLLKLAGAEAATER